MSRVILLLLVFSFMVYGQSFKDTEAYQRGRQMGEQGRGQWGGKENLKGKLQDPASKGGDLVDIYGNRHRLDKGAVCQIADESTQRVVLEVTLSGTNNVTVRWSSDGNSLDRSYSYSGRFLCLDPPSFCSGLTPFTSSTNCTVLNISGGNISTSASNTSPGGCYDTAQSMVVDTVSLARSFSSLLFNDYRSRGIKLEFYKIDETSNQNSSTARVYAVQFKDCSGNPEVNRMSEYQKNPYKAREDALAFYLLCDPDDPDRNKAVACRTLRSMDTVGGLDKNSPTSRRTCSISRDVNNSVTFGRDDQLVCEPGTKVYFNGYNESNPWCVAGNDSSKFFNLHVSFWLECNKDGKGYTLKGWAYWEGAPCGSASYFPPTQPQVTYPVNIYGSVSNVLIGRLSVNRRRGGEGISSGDKVTPLEAECISEGNTPWEVYVDVNGTTQDQPVTINVRIPAIASLGSPWSGCANFSFSGKLGLIGERFNGDCSGLEGCKLVNEWFVDANGKRYQVVRDGEVVSVYKQCRELVYNNLNKSYTSSQQTYQSPPENCQGIPKTCKTVGGTTECRTWWRIDREYDCANTRTLPSVDTSTYAHTIENTTYNPSSGILSIPYKPGASCDSSGYCYPVSFLASYYQCNVNNQKYDTQSLCVDNCYEQGTCDPVVDRYKCSYNSVEYTSEQQCLSACRENVACQSVYYCPLNGNRYNDTNSCFSACNNCQQTGSCSPVEYYRCSLNNTNYSSSSSCQSACSQTGSCNQEYYCSEGSLSGQNCVINPTGTCPSGYSLSGSVCVASPTCSLGSYNSQRDRCETNPTCPSGYTWNSSRKRCEINPSISCLSGTTWNASRQRCETNPTCPSGFTWNSTRLRCERIPTCPSPGTWDTGRQACIANPTQSCVINSATCTVSHPSIGNVNVPMSCTGGSCSGSTNAYAGGYTVNLYCSIQENSSYSSFYGQYYINQTGEYNTGYSPMSACYSGSVQVPVWVYATSSYAYWNFNVSATLQNTCPSPYTLSGGVCTYQGSCPSGSTYDSTNKVCYGSGTCPSGTTYDSTNGVCYASGSVSCPSGSTYDSANGVCYVAGQCPSGSIYDGTSGVCYADAACPSGGSLNPSTDRCEATAVLTCPSGWTLQNNQCVKPAQVRYRCSLNGQAYSDQSSCQNACVNQGTCSLVQKYKCSLNNSEYDTQGQCSSSCITNIQDCCGQRSYCSVNNQLYTDVSQCSTQCVKQHNCQPINSYVCSFTSVKYSDGDECSLRCKRPGQCSFGQETRQVYKCSSSGATYSDQNSCEKACSNNCSSESMTEVDVGTFSKDNACPGQSLYCIVKRPNPLGRPKYEMDTLECAKSGDSWVCPSGGAQIVENCKCGSELKQGFNYAVSVLGILDQALKDRSCEP